MINERIIIILIGTLALITIVYGHVWYSKEMARLPIEYNEGYSQAMINSQLIKDQLGD